jgi:hypothetical protein
MWFALSKSIRSPYAISPIKAFEQVWHVLGCYSDPSVLTKSVTNPCSASRSISTVPDSV